MASISNSTVLTEDVIVLRSRRSHWLLSGPATSFCLVSSFRRPSFSPRTPFCSGVYDVSGNVVGVPQALCRDREIVSTRRPRTVSTRHFVSRPSRRMLHTVLVVVVTFVVCQTPYYMLQWVAVAKQRDAVPSPQGARDSSAPDISQLYVLVVANMFSQILVFVSSCCNPIIYGLLNDNYRTFCFFAIN